MWTHKEAMKTDLDTGLKSLHGEVLIPSSLLCCRSSTCPTGLWRQLMPSWPRVGMVRIYLLLLLLLRLYNSTSRERYMPIRDVHRHALVVAHTIEIIGPGPHAYPKGSLE
jgi:hypothetical protein